jgi:hypothetical protein
LLFCRNLSPADVNDVLDVLDLDDSYVTDQVDEEDRVGLTYVNITVEPPTEEPGVATDCDTDGSDDEVVVEVVVVATSSYYVLLVATTTTTSRYCSK